VACPTPRPPESSSTSCWPASSAVPAADRDHALALIGVMLALLFWHSTVLATMFSG